MKVASGPSGIAPAEYWRLLFHSRIQGHLESQLGQGKTIEVEIGERIRNIGSTEFEEIRNVLHQEGLLPSGENDREVYIAFATWYLELRYFAPSLLEIYFPSIKTGHRIDQILQNDVDAAGILAATRPQGTGDPVSVEPPPQEPLLLSPQDLESQEEENPLFGLFGKRLEKANKAGYSGNVVRAAILRAQAARLAPEHLKEEVLAGAKREIKLLAIRLGIALHLEEDASAQWENALVPVLKPAARGIWPVENRLLYDLQKVCLDHEKELYSVDLVDWALALGRRPFKRPLPFQKAVLKLKHLRSASGRLKRARVSEPDRLRLARLLQFSVQNLETNIRSQFRPTLLDAIAEVGMIPHNRPETVAQHKLIEELLDRIIERGFFQMSDVRDAISRNNLKLPDLDGLPQLIKGDRLIRLNRLLQLRLDGVYRGGEIYLRGLQRFSSIAFGTRLGRFVTRYLVLPFGGAFFALEGLKHIVELVVHSVAHTEILFLKTKFFMVIGTLVLGAFLFGLLHSSSFRRLVVKGLGGLWQGFRRLFIDIPAILLHLPVVQQLLQSPPFRFFRKVVFKPAGYGILTWLLLGVVGMAPPGPAAWGGMVFIIVSLFLNTRIGEDLEAALINLLVRLWQRISFDLLPGIFRFVMYLSRLFIESVDRALYEVDEWLRFRTGDSVWTLVAKPVLGLFWFFLSYIVRFGINVLLEPQINPIKHFPVVTVSHKLVMPLFVPPFTRFLSNSMERPVAGTVAFSVGTAIPGAFGFLVWEFKENWRLYEATRPATLEPVLIGHHGETMVRFLKPGFHSGTIPKLFAKLRKAAPSGHRQGNWKSFRKHRESLHHVENTIRHFTDREFVFLLGNCADFKNSPLETGAIDLATNRIQVELLCPKLGPANVVIVFAIQDNSLVSWIGQQGWLEHLSSRQSQVLQIALTGLFKMAGVDLFFFPANFLCKSKNREVYFENLEVSWQDWVRTWENGPKGIISQTPRSFFDKPPECAGLRTPHPQKEIRGPEPKC